MILRSLRNVGNCDPKPRKRTDRWRPNLCHLIGLFTGFHTTGVAVSNLLLIASPSIALRATAASRLHVGHLSSLESFPKAACRQHQPRWQLRTLATTPCDRRADPPESGRRFSTRERCKCALLLRPPWSAAPRHCITNATITGRYPR